MKAYSMDLRQRVLHDVDAGMKTGAIAEKYTVSPVWGRRLKQRRGATSEVAPRQQRHGQLAGWLKLAERIREAVSRAPDATLAEFRQRFRIPPVERSSLRLDRLSQVRSIKAGSTPVLFNSSRMTLWPFGWASSFGLSYKLLPVWSWPSCG